MLSLSIFEFTDYRKFLASLLKQPGVKGSEPLARALGFSSARHFRLILSGERNLTVDSIFKIARHQKFSLREHQYLEALVHKDQSEVPAVQSHYREIARRLKAETPQNQKVQKRELQHFTDLFLPAICLIANGHKNTPLLQQQIASSLRLEKSLVSSIIKKSIEQGYLSQEENQSLHLTASHFVLKDNAQMSLSIQNYIQRQIELCRNNSLLGRPLPFFKNSLQKPCPQISGQFNNSPKKPSLSPLFV